MTLLALGSGEKPTAESVADAIANNQAELVHLPSAIDLHTPLPSKDCPTCDGTVRLLTVVVIYMFWSIVSVVFHHKFLFLYGTSFYGISMRYPIPWAFKRMHEVRMGFENCTFTALPLRFVMNFAIYPYDLKT